MNCLIFFPEEIIDNARVIVSGEHARYVRQWHDLKVGVTVRAGIWGGSMGHATVLKYEEDCIECSVQFNEEPPKKNPIECIVAVPRPQTVKKVLHAAMSFGVRVVHFVRTENTVRSYLTSHVLQSDGLRTEILKAMEQVCDTIPVEVQIHNAWHRFARDVLPTFNSSTCRYLAHTRASSVLLRDAQDSSRVIAIGPESGWTEEEVSQFTDHGFSMVSLGARMLRVEHALVALIS